MMYGWKQAQIMVRRELDIQALMARKAGLNRVLNTPLLLGPVGGGKTSMAQIEADERGMDFCPINSGELSDPSDFGIPIPQLGEDGKHYSHMEYCLIVQIKRSTEEPMFLFFDDLDKAPPQVQGAFLSISGSRMFRDRPLHPGTLIMGAGNRIGDDMYANEISESIRTRMTIIEMEPDLPSFIEYGSAGEIHKSVLGYLQYKPAHLSAPQQNVNRFPCPRAWWEASRHLEACPDPFEDVLGNGSKDNWKRIVSLKCGDHVGNDYWAWFKIISRVNVTKILRHGVLDTVLDDEGKPADRRMAQYAAIYAISSHLADHGVKPSYAGLAEFIEDRLDPELQVGLAVQLPQKVLSEMSSVLPEAAKAVMTHITKTTVKKAAT